MTGEYIFEDFEPGDFIIDSEIMFRRADGQSLKVVLEKRLDFKKRTILKKQSYPISDVKAFDVEGNLIWSVWDSEQSDLPKFDFINMVYATNSCLKMRANNNFDYDLDPFDGRASSKGWAK